MRVLVLSWLSLVAALVLVGAASGASLFSNNAPATNDGALINIRVQPEGDQIRASLFADRQGGSLFAPVIRETTPDFSGKWTAGSRAGVTGLFDLIAKAEAGSAGYNAVVWSARIKTPRPPTQMTIGEIYHWIKVTPGQNHAIGRYQFIPDTLRRLVQIVGFPPSTRFTPEVQDRLAYVLLQDAGLNGFENGQLSKTAFMNNLAKIWAGLPNSSGRSHYHGFAGNKATLTWPRFKAEMARIFPG